MLNAFIFMASLSAFAEENPTELGGVHWLRDLDTALIASKREGKPVFALFQEIPGCATCVNFGKGPLSHPLLVEAIETEFIPLAVYNNRQGKDAQTLKRFGEPSWNNPVVRFLGANGKDVISRKDRVWSTGGISERMVAALKSASRPIPDYLNLARMELAERQEKATFAMHCFWDGEAKLGSLDGVTASRPGWVGGYEVVEVTYNPSVIKYETLVKSAQQFRCASKVFAHRSEQLKTATSVVGKQVEKLTAAVRETKESDRKFALRRSRYAKLSLTPMQQTKVNAALRLSQSPDRWLSPRQKAALK